MTRGGAASDRERDSAPAGERLRPGPGGADPVRPFGTGPGGRAVRGTCRICRPRPVVGPGERARRKNAAPGAGPRGQSGATSTARRRHGGPGNGREGRGGAAPDPLVPEQRTGRGAHRATSLRKLRPRSRWSKGIAAGGLTVGVAAGAFGGVAAASTDALPGDSLYPVKRGMEDIKLGMADEDSDRGELYLDQASNRLSEARRLMERGRTGVLDHESLGAIRRALAGMSHDAAEGHRLLQAAYERDGSLGPMQMLSSFSRSHRDAWGKLREKLPAQLTDVGGEVESVFQAIDEDVAPIQNLLPKPPEQSRGATGGQAKPSASPGKQQPESPAGQPAGVTPERAPVSGLQALRPRRAPGRHRRSAPPVRPGPRHAAPLGSGTATAPAGHHPPAAPPRPAPGPGPQGGGHRVTKRSGARRTIPPGTAPSCPGPSDHLAARDPAVRRRRTAAARAAGTRCAVSAPAPGPSG